MSFFAIDPYSDWKHWSVGDDLPKPFQHWTKHGTLRIEPETPQGMLFAALYLNNRKLGSTVSPKTIAEQLFAGVFDEQLGFSPKAEGVPAKPVDWSGYR